MINFVAGSTLGHFSYLKEFIIERNTFYNLTTSGTAINIDGTGGIFNNNSIIDSNIENIVLYFWITNGKVIITNNKV